MKATVYPHSRPDGDSGKDPLWGKTMLKIL